MADGSATVNREPITVPPGQCESPNSIRGVPIGEVNHVRGIFRLVTEGKTRRVEQIVQLRPGDCVLTSWLNTISLERAYQTHDDGTLPMTPVRARLEMMRMREKTGEHVGISSFIDSGLNGIDVMNLFSSIYEGSTPNESRDLVTMNAAHTDATDLSVQSLDLLTKLADADTYPSGLMVIGSKGHCRVLKQINGGKNYLLIDPYNHAPIDAATYSSPGHIEEYAKATTILQTLSIQDAVGYLANSFKGVDGSFCFLVSHPRHAQLRKFT